MKTLYKGSHLAAAAIVGSFVLTAGTAVAVTRHSHQPADQSRTTETTQVSDMGRFVVTAKRTTYVRPAESVGRFVVSQSGAVFVPAD